MTSPQAEPRHQAGPEPDTPAITPVLRRLSDEIVQLREESRALRHELTVGLGATVERERERMRADLERERVRLRAEVESGETERRRAAAELRGRYKEAA